MDNKATKNIKESIEKELDNVKVVEGSDTIGFECRRCGKCCSNLSNTILNPYDVYRMITEGKYSTKDLVDEYLQGAIDANAGIPLLRIKKKNLSGSCAFLKSDPKTPFTFTCGIDDYKPASCRNYPIGVVRRFPRNTTDATETFLVKIAQCNHSHTDKEITIDEFMKPYYEHEKEYDMAFKVQTVLHRWFNPSDFFRMCKTLNIVTVHFNKNDDGETGETMKKLINKIVDSMLNAYFNICYFSYTPDLPFIEQAEKAIETLNEIGSMMAETFNVFKETFFKEGENVDDFIDRALKDKEVTVIKMSVKIPTISKKIKEMLKNSKNNKQKGE